MITDTTVLANDIVADPESAEHADQRDPGLRQRVLASFRTAGTTRSPGAARSDATDFYDVADAPARPSGLPVHAYPTAGLRRRVVRAFRAAGAERSPTDAMAEAKAFYGV
ncbi:MAG: hypothetical protein KTR31_18205 [Myxococcales bacterium]|nr:hypothetical protein [Myxococcales bacterium]